MQNRPKQPAKLVATEELGLQEQHWPLVATGTMVAAKGLRTAISRAVTAMTVDTANWNTAYKESQHLLTAAQD